MARYYRAHGMLPPKYLDGVAWQITGRDLDRMEVTRD